MLRSRSTTFVDRTGQRKGKMVAVAIAGRASNNKNFRWLFRCDCGGYRECYWKSTATSCGCDNKSNSNAGATRDRAWKRRPPHKIDVTYAYKDRNYWSNAVLAARSNICERCGWKEGRCDAHHRIPKSQGGQHTVENGIVLCPNCHRVEHERMEASGIEEE